MAKTKQTARKVDQPVRQAGMEPAILAPSASQHEEVPQEGEEVQVGAEEVEVTQPGEQVTTEQDPVDPTGQPGTSTAPTPGTSASTGAAETTIYMNKCQGLQRYGSKRLLKEGAGIS